jgi:rubredoxin
VSNFTSFSQLDNVNLTEEQRGQIVAALTVALKGKLFMHTPCPRCDRAKCLFEKIDAEGSIRHECRSCGYLMVWSPRDPMTKDRILLNNIYADRMIPGWRNVKTA